jgi:D-alanyl-lipoteichoic acid acyltransferase DltB (MBOAT superfamily)
MMPQFKNDTSSKQNVLSVVLTIFTIGLAKKVIFADRVAVYATPLFDAVANGGNPTFLDSWLGGLAYALQLYYDFSGYTDMAVGIARCFGIILPLNFNSPYKAINISDFWRRWHMTLSRFLRDYVYIPLGGNRKGQVRKLSNLFSTMLLGGLWHGAGWTFVAWGGLHGTFLIGHELWRKVAGVRTSTVAILFGWLTTMAAVIISWIPFRCESLSSSLVIVKSMLGLHGFSLPESMSSLPFGIPSMLSQFGFTFNGAYNISIEGSEAGRIATILILTAITIIAPNTQQIMINYEPALVTYEGDISKPGFLGFTWEPTRTMAFLFGASLFVSISQIGKISPFLYFNF